VPGTSRFRWSKESRKRGQARNIFIPIYFEIFFRNFYIIIVEKKERKNG